MEAPLAVGIGLIVFGVVAYSAHQGAGATERTFTAFFRGHQPDPWPRGVQEEYLDTWGSKGWESSKPANRATAELVPLQIGSGAPTKALGRPTVRTILR